MSMVTFILDDTYGVEAALAQLNHNFQSLGD